VVVVPGLGLDARAWSRVWPHLSMRSTVVTLPAMGRSAHGIADLSVQAQVRRLLAALPPHGGLVLVGHSASCQVVVEVAADSPRVQALVLVGPTTDPAAATWPRIVSRWLRTARHERPWEPGVLAPQYRRTGLVSLVRGMEQIRRHRTDLALGRASTRVLVIRGEHDRIAPARWCQVLATLSGGSVTTVAGAGHMVPLTHPQVVGSAIEHHLLDDGRVPEPAPHPSG
jgi:pimeloyl-ACP methyl ester carboxylesterase